MLRLFRITDNMAKLVDSATTVRPFIPKLLPGLLKIENTIGDPEARGVVGKAIATLRQVGEVPEGSDGTDLPPLKTVEPASLATSLVSVYKKAGASPAPSTSEVTLAYVSRLAANLVSSKNFEPPQWQTLTPFLGLVKSSPNPQDIASEFMLRSASEGDDETGDNEDEGEGEDLCNCTFSLAYGAKILLNTASLRLKRGNRYGLCGRNGTGKSTLMRAITNG